MVPGVGLDPAVLDRAAGQADAVDSLLQVLGLHLVEFGRWPAGHGGLLSETGRNSLRDGEGTGCYCGSRTMRVREHAEQLNSCSRVATDDSTSSGQPRRPLLRRPTAHGTPRCPW